MITGLMFFGFIFMSILTILFFIIFDHMREIDRKIRYLNEDVKYINERLEKKKRKGPDMGVPTPRY